MNTVFKVFGVTRHGNCLVYRQPSGCLNHYTIAQVICFSAVQLKVREFNTRGYVGCSLVDKNHQLLSTISFISLLALIRVAADSKTENKLILFHHYLLDSKGSSLC